MQKLEGEAVRVGALVQRVLKPFVGARRVRLLPVLVGVAAVLFVAGWSVGGAQDLERGGNQKAARIVTPTDTTIARTNASLNQHESSGADSAALPIPSIFAPETTFVQTAQSAIAAQHMIRNVMSPFCPGLSLEACPSPDAQLLRTEIRRSIAEGESEDHIRATLVKEYGRGVLGIPPDNVFGAFSWALPWIALVGAGVIVTLWLRKKVRSSVASVGVGGLAYSSHVSAMGANKDEAATPGNGEVHHGDAALLERLQAALAKDDEPQEGEDR